MVLTPRTIYFDKKCGASGIPDNAKCSKSTAAGTVAGPAKEKGKPINYLGVLGAGWQAGSAAYRAANYIDLYRKSGGEGAYGIAAASQVASGVLAGMGLREQVRGNQGRGGLYQLGAYGTSVGGLFGAQAYVEYKQREREKQSKTGYTGSNPFKDLGVKENASPEELRKAYLRRAAAAHPDRGGSNEEMARLNLAYKEAQTQARSKTRTGKAPQSVRPPRRSPNSTLLRASFDSIWAEGFAP